MPQWLSIFSHSNGHNDGSGASNGNAMRTSTAVENHVLPFPVTQGSSATTPDQRNTTSIGWKDYLIRFKRRIGTGTEPSSGSLIGESATESAYVRRLAEGLGDGIVDEVVVDRPWTEGIQTSTLTPHSDCGPEKTASQQHDQRSNDATSVVYYGWWSAWKLLAIIRWHTWPFLMEFFSSRFPDQKTERHYAQVAFFQLSSLSYGSLILLGKLVSKETSGTLGVFMANFQLGIGLSVRSKLQILRHG